MKDCRGQEIEIGSTVAVASQTYIYTGVVIDIKENNSKWYRNAVELAETSEHPSSRRWYKNYLEKCPLVFKIRKDEDGKVKKLEYYKRILVISPVPDTIEK